MFLLHQKLGHKVMLVILNFYNICAASITIYEKFKCCKQFSVYANSPIHWDILLIVLAKWKWKFVVFKIATELKN